MKENYSKKNFNNFFENKIVNNFINKILAKTINNDYNIVANYILIVFTRE